MKDVLKNNWINRMTMAMCIRHPELPRSKVDEMVSEIYRTRFKDTEVQLFNNYENTIANTSLSQVVDWFQTATPLIAESGTYFYQKKQKRNINIEIIKEDMLDSRTIHKKEKFEAMKAGDEFLAAVKDLQQANDKKAANSGYGAEGQSSSFLYNIHSASSVTSCGRGQISTACQCFENLLEDNVKFFHMTEFYNWIYTIIHERPDWKYDAFEVIKKVPTREQYVNRYTSKFGHESLCNEEEIGQVYDWLDDELRIRTYYKANLREFFALRKPRDLYSDIVCTDIEFIDPNKIPEVLKKPVDKLTDWVMEFVAYKHGIFRYEDRTRYQKRKACIVID